jgi:hypothetical protein
MKNEAIIRLPIHFTIPLQNVSNAAPERGSVETGQIFEAAAIVEDEDSLGPDVAAVAAALVGL